LGSKNPHHLTSNHLKHTFPVKYLIAGRIEREYVISTNGVPHNNFLGGNLSYAFAGLRYWDQSIGLISRLSVDFPLDRLAWFTRMGADISGIKQKTSAFEQRSFCRVSQENIYGNDALAHYAHFGMEFPKELLDFQKITGKTALPPYLSSEIPLIFLNSECALILPDDILAQTSLITYLGKVHLPKYILAPSPEFMYPRFWDEWCVLFKNLDVLLTNEKSIRVLCNEPQKSLWEIMENISILGVKGIILNKEKMGYWIFNKSTGKKWILQNYPIQEQYPVGAEAAFSGGALFGYQKSDDLLEAALYGAVSASLMAGGVPPFSIFDSLPGLAEARLEVLKRAFKAG
jgi:hypothetical protein